jgi:hypothetical protein
MTSLCRQLAAPVVLALFLVVAGATAEAPIAKASSLATADATAADIAGRVALRSDAA